MSLPCCWKGSSFSSLNMMLVVGFLYTFLITLRRLPVGLVCWAFLSWIVLNFVKCFFCIVDVIVFFLSLLMVHMLNQRCIPGINLTGPRDNILCIHCWNQVTDILLRIFSVSVHERHCLLGSLGRAVERKGLSLHSVLYPYSAFHGLPCLDRLYMLTG